MFHHRYLQRCVSIFSFYFSGVMLSNGIMTGAILSATVITTILLVSLLTAFHHSKRISFSKSVGRIAHNCCFNVSGICIAYLFLGFLASYFMTRSSHVIIFGK